MRLRTPEVEEFEVSPFSWRGHSCLPASALLLMRASASSPTGTDACTAAKGASRVEDGRVSAPQMAVGTDSQPATAARVPPLHAEACATSRQGSSHFHWRPGIAGTTSGVRRLVLALLFCAALATAQSADPWKNFTFLLGNWTGVAGEKDTQVGAGQGAFSFDLELNKKIITRKNAAHYDSGAQHDDLMVIYLDPPTNTPRAIYFDSEGHTIRYNITFPEANRVVFESDGSQPGPKFRLTYWRNGSSLDGKFELSPPGAGWQPYLQWTSKKK